MSKAKNTQGKMRDKDDPYEVWRTPDGSWEWRVLKKYQAPHNEVKNPYARWFCAVKSPMTYGQFELGDTYVHEIKQYALAVEGEGRP
jgi:hypothetical protein